MIRVEAPNAMHQPRTAVGEPSVPPGQNTTRIDAKVCHWIQSRHLLGEQQLGGSTPCPTPLYPVRKCGKPLPRRLVLWVVVSSPLFL